MTTKIRLIPDIVKGAVKDGTGEKPQHKVWRYQNAWWLALPRQGFTYFWRLTEQGGWIQSTRILDQGQIKADVVVHGNLVHVLAVSTETSASSMISLEYSSQDEEYRPWHLQPHAVPVPLLASRVETATLALDGSNRMWITTVIAGEVLVCSSNSPYDVWSKPISLENGVSSDDISAILPRPDGSVIVVWSDQRTRSFAARVRYPNDREWLHVERFSDGGRRIADDHLSGVVSASGSVYVAVKTSLASEKPKIALLWRDSAAVWRLKPVSETGTRPVVVLDEISGRIHVLYASSEGGGDILMRSTYSSDPVFVDRATVVIPKTSYRRWNNPTVAGGPVQGSFVVASCRHDGYRVRSALLHLTPS